MVYDGEFTWQFVASIVTDNNIEYFQCTLLIFIPYQGWKIAVFWTENE